jgi:hypothetical protein
MDKLKLFPEVIASINEQNDLDLYLIWSVLKTVDMNNNKDGLVSCADFFTQAELFLKKRQSSLYILLNKGIGKFWSKPGGKKGKRQFTLFSLKRILKQYSPKILSCHSFLVPFEEILELEKWVKIKHFMLSLVVGRFDNLKPISQQSLAKNCSVSKSTIKRVVKNNHHLLKIKNFLKIDVKSDDDIKYIENQKILCLNHRYHLIEMLPNTYISNIEREKSFKNPIILKDWNKCFNGNIYPKKYDYKNNYFMQYKKEVVCLRY